MSYVDLMGSVRWTEQDHTNRSEAFVHATVPHAREHIMMRRMLSMILLAILPADNALRALCTAPTPEQMGEVVAAAAAYAQAETASNEGRADAALLDMVLDIEEVSDALAAIPPAPDEGDDPNADLRAAAAGRYAQLMADASPEALALLNTRAAARAPVLDPAPAEEVL